MISYSLVDGQWQEATSLAAALKLSNDMKVMSFIGSGGKSSLIRMLAREMARKGQSVAITTTTHIQPIENWIDDKEQALKALQPGAIVTIADRAAEGKLKSPGASWLARVRQTADLTLIEADGAKMRPLKYPATHEPVIDPASDLVVLVVGLSSLFKPVESVCHRAALARNEGIETTGEVSVKLIAELLAAGYLRDRHAPSIPLVVALNQVDNERLRSQAAELARLLRQDTAIEEGAISAHFIENVERV